jgi:hypothetical protein
VLRTREVSAQRSATLIDMICDSPQSLATRELKGGQDHFVPLFSRYIIHYSSYHSTPCRPLDKRLTESIKKQQINKYNFWFPKFYFVHNNR